MVPNFLRSIVQLRHGIGVYKDSEHVNNFTLTNYVTTGDVLSTSLDVWTFAMFSYYKRIMCFFIVHSNYINNICISERYLSVHMLKTPYS